MRGTNPRTALLAQARTLRERDDFHGARALCMQVLRDAPQDADAMAVLAALAADQRQVDGGMQWAQGALAADPLCIPAHFARGRLLEGAERYAEAEASYRRVTELDPAYAKAHTNLGCMLHIQGRMTQAVACYRQALALEPDQPEALRNYALIAGGSEQIDEALHGFERHVAAHPRDAAAHCQLGHLYMHQARYDEALASYERALALQPEVAEFHYARAQALLLLGRYEEGWQEYDWRWRIELLSAAMTRFPHPRWDGKPLAGTLLLHEPSGFGDVFQFVRYAPVAARLCERVLVECQPALLELVAGMPGITAVSQREPLPQFDAHLPMPALPHVFGTTLATIPWDGPYLHADEARTQVWRQRVDAADARGRKVGLVWAGNPANLADRERSVRLQDLGPLAAVPDVTFFSLQKGVAPGTPPAGMHFVDFTAQIADFSDTAALLSQMDLVVSIDTSVAHLAGAMDKPCWVLLPFSADWRYHTGRSDNPWYPRMRLFRQARAGDWSAPLQDLAAALRG